MKSNRVAVLSKWTKTKVLLQNKSIKPFIPDTRKFNMNNLRTMIHQYKMVYVKPECGTHGKGVIRAEMIDEYSYKYQINENILKFKTFSEFHKSLVKQIKKRRYLIQKGIHLLKQNHRRFDIRVMVQVNPKGRWETTGIIGRLGHARKIVTNYHSEGKPMSIESLLHNHLSRSQQTQLHKKLSSLGIQIASHLSKTYPKFRQIGVDIGLDKTITPQIIEVNTQPDPYIFNQLKDKSMYRRVMSCRRATVKK
ncbi:YheC/YheD family protein [Paenibacillus segetis]|uniref:YheC/D like ATP-grasp n=1 Tax=Paenibacillus segetis TaxID=1325360 RepID=A0ABQ1Y8U4_9BACL|nr:YheC/YheD family protein [Paenibacillus segetis]GGH15800.1 hypothetical protein GCM10008013_10220 [Paenibacillus segetis]